MKSVAIYHKSVPNNKNAEKIDLLRYFSQGVAACGDRAIDVNDYNIVAADAGVIQGWVTEAVTRPHQVLRHQVIKQQKHTVSADSNLFLYADSKNSHHYLRYSFDGVFPSTGNYCDTQIDPARWQQISQDLGIALKDYRTNGDHILLCLQRNGGWSMGSFSTVDWAAQAIVTIRAHSDRKIIVRPHPGDRKAKEYIGSLVAIKDQLNVELSETGRPLLEDLKNCWAAVNHNSSPVVGAAIEGVPIFVTDPNQSQCKEIANTDFSQIENPILFERQNWVERLSMFHWNFNELASGACWRHMRNFI